MNKTFIAVALSAMALMLSCCGRGKSAEEQIAACADSFAVNYFNWHFAQAAWYCTPDSRQWLQFAASQVTPADQDVLKSKDADLGIEITDIDVADDERLADITLQVNNYIGMQGYGEAAVVIPHATYRLTAVNDGGVWRIRMAAPLQSERQSRD